MKKNKQSSLLLLLLFVFHFACTTSNHTSSISTIEQQVGSFEGKPVMEYTLTNANGMQVGIINYGGILTKIITQDKQGNFGDVLTG